MGRRSRRRLGDLTAGEPVPTADPDRSPQAGNGAGEARVGRKAGEVDGPPEPPWGSFPLTEFAVFASLAMVVGGFLVGGPAGTVVLVTGLLLGSLAGLEQAVREHRGGYRPHSAVIAGVPAVATITVLALFGVAPVVFGPLGLAVAIGVWLPVRASFTRRER